MKNNKIIFKRLRIYGIVGILYSIYLEYDHFFVKNNNLELMLGILLFLASIVFLLAPLINKSHHN